MSHAETKSQELQLNLSRGKSTSPWYVIPGLVVGNHTKEQ